MAAIVRTVATHRMGVIRHMEVTEATRHTVVTEAMHHMHLTLHTVHTGVGKKGTCRGRHEN